ncbi:MAG: phospho-sugar mutase [Clostridia bacterium]|nr:phospho-sugar mutase [Clostridia bacterium]
MTYEENYQRWLTADAVDEATKAELRAITDPDEIKMRFSGYMTFGTGGLRSVMGAGTARMNLYTVAHATEGLARLILKTPGGAERGVAVCYDSRNHSADFARRAAEVLSADGIRVYLFSELRPTPVLSFAVRHYGCIAGINVTASHNPAEYNGYKVYWEDGGQLPPDHAATVSAEIAKVDIFDGVPSPERANPSLITMTDASLDEAYIKNVLAERVNPDAIPAVADSTAIVYTPLHGTGGTLIPDMLRKAGLTKLYTVDAQMEPNGDFPTVKFPNPEFPEAFTLGIEIANSVGSDLIIATDPDTDRVGAMAKNKAGEFCAITGNQMGALLLEYICTAYEQTGKMPADAYAVKTIVTSELSARVCEAHGVKLYNVLTGFKFIGEIIKQHEEAGHGTFLLGFEESYGYLKGTYARDKDAVVATLLIAEMAAYYKTRGMTLIDALDELFEKYGYFREEVFSIGMSGADAQEKMAALMKNLRENPPREIGGKAIATVKDYLTEKTLDVQTGAISGTGLPKSDVLWYLTEDGNLIVVRPSGTEPKVKVYVLANGKTDEITKECARVCAAGIREILG